MAQPNGIAQDGSVPDQPNKDAPPSQPSKTPISSNLPATSLTDNGLSKRPRDARLIHMILANLGVTAYQERVPLQLMDFAYRYTSSTLQDALHLSSEGYGAGRAAGTGPNGDLSSITLPALRLSIASRLNYQFSPSLPKEFLQDMAQERNRVALPSVGREWGVRLPPERYCLTGVGWGLKEEWDSDGEVDGEDVEEGGVEGSGEKTEGDWDGEGAGEDEEGDERMEDVFGDHEDAGEGDRQMGDA
ncbi:Transcription initiation factor TFIID subunit 9 [Acarospora aff. strigata]|nr:Transcription initiation factor TFIID subunit 9 [Acarospora aff. strigata]